jgi:hypothetical protein
VGHVGKPQQLLAFLPLKLLEFARQPLDAGLDFGGPCLHRFGLGTAAVAHQSANLLRKAVGFGLKRFGFGLNSAAFLVQAEQGLNGRLHVEVALRERRHDGLGIRSNKG